MSNRDKRETHSLPFSPFSFLVGCLLVTAAVAIAYIAGVMSGRASADREHARLALEKNTPQPSVKAPETVQESGVLLAEELEYARALRSDVTRSNKTQTFTKKVAEVKETPIKSTAGTGTANAGELTGTIQETQTSTVLEVKPERFKAPEPVNLHDYIFQVAALRSEDAVDALRQRLEGRGLRTKMQREGKMYLVLVMLRGDEGRAAEVVQILEGMRLGKPITRSRKAVVQ